MQPEPYTGTTPANLRRFVAAEWAADEETAAERWHTARFAWEDEHGEAPDVDEDASFTTPDCPWSVVKDRI